MKRISILLLILVASTALAAQDWADSIAYPMHSTPFGMTYGDWQAAYWQYLFSIPASINPVLDTTGADCNVAQSSGPVFFLNSAFLGGPPVTRTCTIPAKALLIAVAGWECSSVEPPPSYGANPQDMRTCAATAMDGIGTLKLSVDGKNLSQLLRAIRVQSPYYAFTMPATDNILGLDGVTSGFSVSDGYLVMLKPLSPGYHVIHLFDSFVSGPAAGLSAEVTYKVAVQ